MRDCPPPTVGRLTRCRSVGATIVGRTDEIREEHIGTECGLFEVAKIGDEYFTFFVDCDKPKACTILLRGANKDVLNEIERNMADALAVARNVVLDSQLLPGGGATEMAVSAVLRNVGARPGSVSALTPDRRPSRCRATRRSRSWPSQRRSRWAPCPPPLPGLTLHR